ncbi:uncharacterized protein LOC117600626 [Osmia lignaria lignaria]|uniref:uncharacterized protein LOC117600626 n=1 Tax=Osmia lignaria TaxID=473952 RepID=UPI0014785C79|nr:uncharacterized protein LOC117600626 [Osmia lignaria]XP_034172174.1 uncharacterized protein LOC117600626 [Osmia lignaria]XP_034172175.1 uncharacterized protein LOC117600626 [Osmia lignaria]XP_034172176.1 uncharacterized protein LOC117600626 [Osmia lignaria]XP_034172177.1 uncharacterized protein LOC117600626 [Osmia lignaria]
MQTTTIQKRRTKVSISNLKKRVSGENVEKNEKEKNEVTKHKPMELKETTKYIQQMLSSNIDPYDKPLTWWETDHVRYAITYPPVKSRLQKLMGSYVIRLTDYKYMEKLASNLHLDYVEQQKIRIEKRKLPPPSIINRLLEISYKVLSEQIRDNKRNKIKLYV